MSYLGIDIGMTGAKAVVVGENGKVLKRSYTDYGSAYKNALLRKIVPYHIWNGVKEIIRSCQCAQLRDPVKVLSVSVSGDDFFPADDMGKPLANVISCYQDTGIEYEEYIIERGGGERTLFEITGQPVRGNLYPLHRILWIRDHRPEVYGKTWKFLCWEEYINYLLTCECVSDHSLVSRTLLFDINKREWSRSLIENMRLDYDHFPEVKAPGKLIGSLSKDIANELGLPSNCLVATGGFDQATASLGAGVTRSSVFSLSIGTVIASHWLLDERDFSARNDYSYCCSLVGDKHLGLFFSFNGCAVLNWFFRELGNGKNYSTKGKRVYDDYNRQMSADRPSRLFMMPHLGGAMQPYNDFRSKGVFLGIRFDTTSGDMLKSIYEGIAFDLKRNYRALEKDGIGVTEIRAVGGGSRSDVWMQMMANILGYEIATLKMDEGSAMGAALLGACAIGSFGSVEEAVESWIGKKATFQPERKALDQFEEKYQTYVKLYDKVKSFNDFLGNCDD
ncbi:MAG: FGGY family carbohydrate kinase [Candidatus Latescibacterota bacterium]